MVVLLSISSLAQQHLDPVDRHNHNVGEAIIRSSTYPDKNGLLPIVIRRGSAGSAFARVGERVALLLLLLPQPPRRRTRRRRQHERPQLL